MLAATWRPLVLSGCALPAQPSTERSFTNMLTRVVVDFVKTFGRPGIMLSIEPKMVRKDKDNPKSEQVQGSDDEGNLRWVVTVAVPVQAYDREKFENLAITVASKTQPCTNVAPGQ